MKFLILVDQNVGAPPLPDPIAAYEASNSYLEGMLANGRLDCVYNFVCRRPASRGHSQCRLGCGTVGCAGRIPASFHSDL